MNGRKDIEARLDRSLDRQIAARPLDGKFNAAVWARIAESEARATNPGNELSARALRASRWLAISNIVGIAVTLGIAAYFGLRYFGGIGIPADLGVPEPVVPEALVAQATSILGYVLGAAALVLGLSLTSFGRRLRNEFS